MRMSGERHQFPVSRIKGTHPFLCQCLLSGPWPRHNMELTQMSMSKSRIWLGKNFMPFSSTFNKRQCYLDFTLSPNPRMVLLMHKEFLNLRTVTENLSLAVFRHVFLGSTGNWSDLLQLLKSVWKQPRPPSLLLVLVQLDNITAERLTVNTVNYSVNYIIYYTLH